MRRPSCLLEVPPCTGRVATEKMQEAGAADAGEDSTAQSLQDWQSCPESNAATAPRSRLPDPFRADNRAGLSGKQYLLQARDRLVRMREPFNHNAALFATLLPVYCRKYAKLCASTASNNVLQVIIRTCLITPLYLCLAIYLRDLPLIIEPCSSTPHSTCLAPAPGTLHRISAIRDQDGSTIGLTYRIGRHMQGVITLTEEH